MTATTPRERPILFSGEMVCAILEGRKTQTRRPVKRALSETSGGALSPIPETCPFGKPGDHLWVKETWARNHIELSDHHADTSLVYRADGEDRAEDNGSPLPWRPSIHMSRGASRITLEITGVRVERVQEIGEADAKAEGHSPTELSDHGTDEGRLTAKFSFSESWNRIYPGSWQRNDWVWVVEFKRVER